jgi:hypothetical protein
MARYPGGDTTRELISFAVPATVASAARQVCEQNFWTVSHLCRAALLRDLKNRGFDFHESEDRRKSIQFTS